MDAKDLIKDDLTDEQLDQLETDVNKDKFKTLRWYLDSKEYNQTIEFFTGKIEDVDVLIKKEIELRRNLNNETKAIKSELDKSILFYDFQLEIIEQLGDTEAEKILKDDLIENADNTTTHIYNKIEEMYDIPTYSKLDILKQMRIDYIMIGERLQRMVWFYAQEKDSIKNPNPYQDEDEEFKALTDVS